MDRKVLRVAPARAGLQIASAWRFWSQGDEFYAAARDVVNVRKISFHRNGNWQLRFSTAMHRLAPGLKLSGGWTHALELVYLIGDEVLFPKSQHEENIVRVELPPSHKLLVDVILSGTSRNSTPIPTEMRGTTLKVMGLRNGRNVFIIGRVAPFTAQELLTIADMRAKLKVNFATKLPDPGDAYVETSMHSFLPEHGNIVQIIPVGTETFAVEARDHVVS